MIYTDLLLSITGVGAWLVVGLMWKDRALVMLNTAAVMILGSGIVKVLVGA